MFEEIKQQRIHDLIAVGFTDDQARVLVEMMTNIAIGGGWF